MLRSIADTTALASEALPETLSDKAMFALENSVLGIMMVFAVLAILFIVVKIVASIMGKGGEKKSAEAKPTPTPTAPTAPPTPAPVPQTDDGEIIAAITAAISLMLEAEGKDPRGFRVVSFRRSSQRKNSL